VIFKYRTGLEFNECRLRLRDIKGINDPFYSSREPNIRGWILGRWFFLWWQEYFGLFFVRNSFRTICIGKLRPKQNETMIHGYIGMHPLVIFFLFVWFGSLLGFGGFEIVHTILGHSNIISLFFLCLIIGFFLIIGVMLVMVGKLWSGDDRSEIIYFIKNTLNIDDAQ
jgi:hypothetical protein